MRSKTEKRSQIPLTAEDVADLQKLRSPGTLERQCLTEILEELGDDALGDQPSEAIVLHALVELGLHRVREAALERGYAEYAASMTPEDHAFTRASRDRSLAHLAQAD